MKRTLPLLAFLLLISGATSAAQPPATATQESPDTYRSLKQDYDQRQSRFKQEMAKAKTEAARTEVIKTFRPRSEDYVLRAWKVAERTPDDVNATDNLMFILSLTRKREMQNKVAAALLASGHYKSGKIAAGLNTLGGSVHEVIDRLLRKIIAESPHAPARSSACSALSRCLHRTRSIHDALTKLKDEIRLASYAERFGRENVRRIMRLDGEALVAEAKQLQEQAAAERAAGPVRTGLAPGKAAPPVEGKDLDGRDLGMTDYENRVTVVFFWGDWAWSSRALNAPMKQLGEAFDGKPVTILGINGDADVGTARAAGLPWRSIWDGRAGGKNATAWEVRTWPMIFVVDHEGTIRHRNPRPGELRAAVQVLLDELR